MSPGSAAIQILLDGHPRSVNSRKPLTSTPVGDEIEEKKEKNTESSKYDWLFSRQTRIGGKMRAGANKNSQVALFIHRKIIPIFHNIFKGNLILIVFEPMPTKFYNIFASERTNFK
jgi:hypothetical protein